MSQDAELDLDAIRKRLAAWKRWNGPQESLALCDDIPHLIAEVERLRRPSETAGPQERRIEGWVDAADAARWKEPFALISFWPGGPGDTHATLILHSGTEDSE